MFQNIFTEISNILNKNAVDIREIWEARMNAEEKGTIYNEVEIDRINTNFIRIIPASIVLFIVEVCGIVWALWAKIQFEYGMKFFISLCVFCVVSMIFIVFVNYDLDKNRLTNLHKKIFYLTYWLIYTVEATSFSVLEAFDRGTLNNFITFIVVFSILPVIRPMEKAVLYTLAMLTEIGALLYLGIPMGKIERVILATCLGIAFSFGRFYFYTLNSLHTKKLEYSANGDALTGFMNRRGLESSFAGLSGFCRGNDYYLCALMVDIDDFKKFNDTYGHLKGDSCLKIISKEVQKSFIRPTDLCVRYGGEEFLILTAQREIPRFLIHMKEMHESIPKIKISGVDKEVTVSVGLYVTEGKDCEPLETIIDVADKQLYMAKNNGKNCIYYNGEKI